MKLIRYKPLKIKTLKVSGFNEAIKAMRFPKKSKNDSIGFNFKLFGLDISYFKLGKKDKKLALNLIKAGDEHAKTIRGIEVWVQLEFQVGWMIEFETYRYGIDTLSTTSSMHGELKKLTGVKLIETKQRDLPYKVYKRISKVNYQTLRRIYKQRKNHRHNDFKIFCKWIETLPHSELITIN